MKTTNSASIWLSCAFASAITFAPNVRAQEAVRVEPGVRRQVWRGWGTSLAWWAHVAGGHSEAARREYADMSFSLKDGLGLNLVRYNIGGGENPKFLLPNAQYLTFRGAVPGYQSVDGKWNWNADANQRWILAAAIARGANQLEAFSNSPPYWMTKSQTVTGNFGGADNFEAKYAPDFARYLTQVTRHFRDEWKISFDTLEPLNEPSGDWQPKKLPAAGQAGDNQEGAHIDYPNQQLIVGATIDEVRKAALRTRISAPDGVSIDETIGAYESYPKSVQNGIMRINAHSYGGGNRTKLHNIAQRDGKTLWLSEYGDGDASGLTTSRRILEDVRQLRPESWAYWQVVDNWQGWGFVWNPQNSFSTSAYRYRLKYFVMGQYSKYIRPGDQIIGVNDANSLAAFNAQKKTLTLVCTNSDDVPRVVNFDLSRFAGLDTRVQMIHSGVGNQAQQWRLIAIGEGANRKLKLVDQQNRALQFSNNALSLAIDSAAPEQQWNLSDDGGQWHRIERGGMALQANQNALNLSKTSNSPAGQWRLIGVESAGSGGDDVWYRLVNRANGRVLEAGENGVILNSDSGGAWQSTVVTMGNKQLRATLPARSVATFVIGGASYAGALGLPAETSFQILNRASGRALDVSQSSTADAASVGIWDANAAPNQSWSLLALGENRYKIINRNSGLALEIGGELTTPDVETSQYHDKHEDRFNSNQTWHLQRDAAGFCTIINGKSNLALEGVGDKAMQRAPNNQSAQQWRLVAK